MILIHVLAQCLSWNDGRHVLWYTRQSSAAFGLCWSRHSGSFLKKRLIPSLFPFLTSSWLLHFHRKTLPASAWLGVLQLLRQATHKVRAFALTVPFACNTVLPDILEFLPHLMLVSAHIVPYQGAVCDYPFKITPSLPHMFLCHLALADFSPEHLSPSNIHLFVCDLSSTTRIFPWANLHENGCLFYSRLFPHVCHVVCKQ